MRNLDSKIHLPGFDRFKFQFHSFFAETFSTASVKGGKAQREQIFSGLPPKRPYLGCDLREARAVLSAVARSRCTPLVQPWVAFGLALSHVIVARKDLPAKDLKELIGSTGASVFKMLRNA